MVQIFTKYERARILGARALQIAMNAPLLVKISKDDLEKINFDALKIAEVELESDVLPISINKPMPKKREGPLKRLKTPLSSIRKKKKVKKNWKKKLLKKGKLWNLLNQKMKWKILEIVVLMKNNFF